MKTFNSRYLSYQEIAQEFVLTKNFQELTKSCHSVLLGTRGCGKTTMLKMLHPLSVREYQKIYTEFKLDFYGVYIPADRQWSIILEQLNKETQNVAFYEKVSKALVNVNILLAFIDTLKTVERVEILPYHTLGVFKWKELGIPYALEDVEPPTKEQVEHAREIIIPGYKS